MYMLRVTNKTLILEEKRCNKLPEPDNGGVVCSHIFVTNTRRCQVKCNYGFEHPGDPNMFEICGPDTNWQWSYEVANEEIPACIGK